MLIVLLQYRTIPEIKHKTIFHANLNSNTFELLHYKINISSLSLYPRTYLICLKH